MHVIFFVATVNMSLLIIITVRFRTITRKNIASQIYCLANNDTYSLCLSQCSQGQLVCEFWVTFNQGIYRKLRHLHNDFFPNWNLKTEVLLKSKGSFHLNSHISNKQSHVMKNRRKLQYAYLYFRNWTYRM